MTWCLFWEKLQQQMLIKCLFCARHIGSHFALTQNPMRMYFHHITSSYRNANGISKVKSLAKCTVCKWQSWDLNPGFCGPSGDTHNNYLGMASKKNVCLEEVRSGSSLGLLQQGGSWAVNTESWLTRQKQSCHTDDASLGRPHSLLSQNYAVLWLSCFH